jgi:hypothetical protein
MGGSRPRRSELQNWNPDRLPKYPRNGQMPQMRHDIGHFLPKQAMV